jgi:broad specificity phosphatase PhoE
MFSRMLNHVLLFVLLSAPLTAHAQSGPAIFLVRHAERADSGGAAPTTMANDPELSATGHARAKSLATVLKDAGITQVFATEVKRTQQTATPTAQGLGLTVTTVPSKDVTGLVDKLKKATGNVLVVGHSNTVPEIIRALGITPPITISETEFDNLFVLVPGAQPRLVRLHYQ